MSTLFIIEFILMFSLMALVPLLKQCRLHVLKYTKQLVEVKQGGNLICSPRLLWPLSGLNREITYNPCFTRRGIKDCLDGHSFVG